MIDVRRCTVSELENSDGFEALLSEYAAESQLRGLPPASAKMEMYRALDRSPVFAVFGAFDGELIVGIVVVMTPVLPHYGVCVAVTESLFACKSHRKSGTGMKLIRAAETHARDIGSPALLISAPADGALTDILPRLEYHMTNKVFMKLLYHE